MALTKISTAMISQSAAAVDLNVDAGTFYVDTTNNRVGVGGKTDPDTPLHVIGTATATTFAGSGASLTDIPNSALVNSSITINSTAVSLGGSLTLTTANIAENTNLYYTDARADARIAAADTDDLSEGSSNLYYTDARVDARVSGGSLGNITTTGYIRGPATFTLDPAAHGDDTGTVVIAGNLQVDGTTTTINSTTLTVDDKNITLASGSVNAAAADGAGFTVDIGTGTLPAITYDGTNDEWDFNKPLNVTGNIVVSGTISSGAITSTGTILTDGTASNSVPKYSFSGDTDTGLGYVGTNTVGLIAGGSRKFYVNATNAFFQNLTGGVSVPLLSIGSTTVIDSSRNLTNIGTISSGAITATGSSYFGSTSSDNDQHIRGNSNVGLRIQTNAQGITSGDGMRIGLNGVHAFVWQFEALPLAFATSGVERLRIDSSGNLIKVGGVIQGERGTAAAPPYSFSDDTDTGMFNISNSDLGFSVGGTERLRIDSSGNVGIGVSPESHYTGYVGIDFGKSGGLFSNASGTNITGLSNNAYLNSDASAWVYKETDEASSYNQTAGTHRFSVAPSGTAGTAITWSEAMRINASGNVGIGTTNFVTTGAKLQVKGTSAVPATNGSNFTGSIFSVEGTSTVNISMGTTGASGYYGWIQSHDAGTGTNYKLSLNPLGGNVGIGTDAPANKLEVKASGNDNGIMLKSTTNADLIWLHQQTTSEGVLRIYGSGGAKVIIPGHNSPTYFNNGNNVGIGTATPSKKLHIGGTAPGDSIIRQDATSSGTNWEIGERVAGKYQFWEDDGDNVRLTIMSTGNVGIGTDTPTSPLHITHGTPAIKFTDSSSSANYTMTLDGVAVAHTNAGTNGDISFHTHNGEKLRLGASYSYFSNGNVGIGTTSPSELLHVSGASSPAIRVTATNIPVSVSMQADDATGFFSTVTNHPLVLRTNNAERMRINSSGEVVITSSSAPIAPTIKHSGETGYLAKLRIINRSGQSINKGGLLELGGITDDGITRSDIFASVAGLKANSTGNNRTGYMQFSVSNGSSLSEAMRITSAGNIIQGNNGTHSWTANNNTLFAAGGIGVTSNSDWCLQLAGSGTERIRFFTSAGGSATVGNISVNTAGTTYSTTSDVRLKENIKTITDGTDKLMSMNPVTHGWKADPEAATVHGFIAQEMMNIVPEAVVGDPEGEEMMGMDYGRITPIIVAALQDAIKEIKELKTRINELEGK